MPDNLEHTPSFQLHRQRRRIFEHFFSRASIQKFESIIKQYIEQGCLRLDDAHTTGLPVTLTVLYKAVTTDIICEYCFGQPYAFLKNFDKTGQFFVSNSKVFGLIFFFRDIQLTSWILRGMVYLPQWAIPNDEGMKAGFDLQRVRRTIDT